MRKKKSSMLQKKTEVFFVGIAGLLVLVTGLTSIAVFEKSIGSENVSVESHEKVLADAVSNTTTTTTIFYCVGGTADGLCATVTPINSTTTTTTTNQGTTTTTTNGQGNTATASSSTTTDPLVSPSIVVPTSIASVTPVLTVDTTITVPTSIPVTTVIPTIDPNVVYPTSIEVGTNNTITPGNGTNPFMDILMQLISFILNFLNFILGTSLSMPPVSVGSLPPITTIPGTTGTPIATTVASITPDTTSITPSIGGISPTTGAVVPTTGPVFTPIPGVSVYPQPVLGGTWAGYIYTIQSQLTSATLRATWNISQVTCSQNEQDQMSPWVGFGGWRATNIAQGGIAMRCYNGQASYVPWTEAYPEVPMYYTNVADAGDIVTGLVTFLGNGAYNMSVTDTTKGWTISLPMNLPNMPSPISGESVIEVFQSDQYNSLMQFSPPISFSNIYWSINGQAEQPLVSVPTLLRAEVQDTTGSTQTSALTGTGFTISKK